MKKDIGSIFPLNDAVLSKTSCTQGFMTGDRIYYSLCREALRAIALSLADTCRKVLIPAYTCGSVVIPFEESGWECSYYGIRKDLRIDTQALLRTVDEKHPAVVVVHPYYGMDLNENETQALTTISEKGIQIVMDLTQCLFSEREYGFASYIVASYRKWMAIPDGGYMINKTPTYIEQPEMEFNMFAELETAAMYLRGLYFENGEQAVKDLSIRLSKLADHAAERQIGSHKISNLSNTLLQEEDLALNQRQRFENYTYLFKNIRESEKVHLVCSDMRNVSTAPLYFPLYIEDRPSLQHQLAQEAIYAPVLWPLEDERMLIDNDIRYIYEHILLIPCDQRYGKGDMKHVLEIVNTY